MISPRNRRQQEAPYSRDVNRPVIGSSSRFPRGLWTYRPQGTEDWLLLAVVSGRVGVVLPGAREQVFQQGQVLLYAPRTIHDFGVVGAHWETSWAHFTPRVEWMEFLHWPEISAGLAVLDLRGQRESFREILAAMKRLHDVLRTADALIHSRSLAMNAMEEVLLLGDTCARSMGGEQIDRRIARILPLLRERWQTPPSAKQLAKQCGLSLSRFYTLFQAATGRNVGDFLEHQRIEQAKLLLGTSLQPIRSIAASVGFADPYYFSRRFALVAGVSPRAYRVTIRANSIPARARDVSSKHSRSLAQN